MPSFVYANYDSDGQFTNPAGNGLTSLQQAIVDQQVMKKPTVAMYGDSIAQAGFVNGLGNGISNIATGINSWIRGKTGQRVTLTNDLNFGVSGENTTQILARIGQVLAAKPTFCIVIAGTNDFATAVTNKSLTIQNLKSIYDILTSHGIIVIAYTILPKTFWQPGGTIPANIRNQMAYVNNWIRTYCYGTKGLYVADPWSALVDPATGLSIGGGIVGSPPANSAFTYDGLHPSPRGSFYAAIPAANIINAIVPANNTLLWTPNDNYSAADNPTGNLLNNTGMTVASGGTAGAGASGVIAGSWTIARTAGTTGAVVGSIVPGALSSGQIYNKQRMTITAPAGSAIERIRALQQLFVSGIIGKQVVAECEISVSGITGVNAFRGVHLRATDGTNDSLDRTINSGYLFPDAAYDDVYRTQPFLCTANVQQFELIVEIDGTVASAGVTVDFGRTAFRVVE